MTRHPGHCYDDDGELDCACDLVDGIDSYMPEPEPPDYGDPLLDREPMGGDPAWRERDQ